MEDKSSVKVTLPGHTNPTQPPRNGDKIAVYWQDDNKFYSGTVAKFLKNGKVAVHYDDGDKEELLLENEVWKYVINEDLYAREPSPQPVHQPPHHQADQDHAFQTTSAGVQPRDAQVTLPTLALGNQKKKPFSKPKTQRTSPPKINHKPPAKSTSLHTTKVQAKPTLPKKRRNEVVPPVVPVTPKKGEKPPVPVSAAILGSPPVSTGLIRQPAGPISSGIPLPERGQPVSDPLKEGISKQEVGGNVQEHCSSISGKKERRQGEIFGDGLAPLLATYSSQLSDHNRMLSNLTNTISQLNRDIREIDECCRTLRADVDAIESGAISRQEVHKLLGNQEAQQHAQISRELDQGIAEMKTVLSDIVKTQVYNIEKSLSDQVEQSSRVVFKNIMAGIRGSAHSQGDTDDGNGKGGKRRKS